MTTAPIELDFRLKPHGNTLDQVYRGSKVLVYMGGYTAVFVHDQITFKFDDGVLWGLPSDVTRHTEDAIIERTYNMAAARFRPNHLVAMLKAIDRAEVAGFRRGRSSMAGAFTVLLQEAHEE